MKKLKNWVVPTLYIVSISIIFVSVIAIGRIMATDYQKAEDQRLIPDGLVNGSGEDDTTTPVVDITNENINRPYTSDSVNVAKDFYDDESEEDKQLNSIIFYKNTYMENTGVLYSGTETFDVVAVLDGTVTSITDDAILGKVVEVTHSTELITIYHCLGEVTAKIGDVVHQNDVLGKSGKCNIDKGYENALLFEVNYQGKIINPNKFYEMKVSDIVR
ncbi:MAG TPA: hypothetical protein DCY94_02780 [Firmicutes bacterium]|nr:hypothetical protein [Bacillota bacterium]